MARPADRHRRGGVALRRAASIVTLTLLGLATLLLAAYGAVNTEAGRRWLTGVVNRSFAPDLLPGLRIGSIEGSVPFSFTVRDVTVAQPSRGLHGRAEAIHIDTELLALARGTLRLRSVDVVNPELVVGEPEPVPAAPGLLVEDEPSSIELAVERFTVEGGRVELSRGGLEAALEGLSLSGDAWRDADDGVLTVTVRRGSGDLAAAGEVSAARASGFLVAFPDRLNGRFTARAATATPAHVVLRALGPLDALDVSMEASGPHIASLELDGLIDVPQRSWDATLELDGDVVDAHASGRGSGPAFDGGLVVRAEGQGGALRLDVRRDRSGALGAAGALDVRQARFGDLTVGSLNARLAINASPAARSGELELDVAQPFEVNEVTVAPTQLRAATDGRELTAHLTTALMERGEPLEPLRAEVAVPLAGGGLRLDRDAPLSADLRWKNVSLGALARLAGVDAPVRGRLSLQAEARGTVGAPRLEAELSLARVALEEPRVQGHARAEVGLTGTLERPLLTGRLRGAAGPRGGERIAADVELDGEVENGRTVLDFAGTLGGAALTGQVVSASTPAELLGEGVGEPRAWARARVEGLPLAKLSRLAPRAPPVSGTVTAQLSASQLFTVPRVEVTLEGTGVALASRAPGALSLSAKSGDAALTAAGSYRQAQGVTRFEGSLDRQGRLHARVDAERLNLAGLRAYRPRLPLAADRVSGTVTLDGHVEAAGAGRAPLARLGGPGGISGTIVAEQLDVSAYLARAGAAARRQAPAAGAAQNEVRELVRELERARRFHLERLEVKDSRVALVDATQPRRPALDLRRLALTLENVASDREQMRGVPVVFAARASVEGSGELVAFATADPFAQPPVATGRATVKHLELSGLRELLRSYGVVAPAGRFDAYAALTLRGDRIDGGIKPVFTDVDIDPAPSATWAETALAELADFAGDVLAQEGPSGAGHTATIVPLKGELGATGVQLVPAVLVALRNAFVVGLTQGFSNLPLPTAGQPQSLFTQAAQALQSDRFPKAQPRRGQP